MRGASGVWDLAPSKLRAYEGGGIRYMRFRREIAKLQPEMIVFEEVRSTTSSAAAYTYGGLKAIIMEWCESQNPTVPYTAVPVGTIKTHATGKGNASKEAMIDAAAKKWPGVEIIDDNHADALHLLDFATQEWG